MNGVVEQKLTQLYTVEIMKSEVYGDINISETILYPMDFIYL